MGSHVIGTHGLVLLTTAVWLVRGVVPDGNDAVSCLEGRIRCHGNITCANLFDDMEDYCDHSTEACTPVHKDKCQSVLRSLQNNPHLATCTCDTQQPDARECLDVQNRIFLHACVRKDGASTPIRPWHRHSSHGENSPSAEELEAIEQSLDKELSCIGVRQLCLRNMECHEAFKVFQDVCTMKKDQDVCTAGDRQSCYRAIETIRPTGLFDCECKTGMKQYTLDKCERIQARLTRNPCLVSVPYFIHSTNPHETSYADLVRSVESAEHSELPEKSCVAAMRSCNADLNCRLRFAQTVTACAWDRDSDSCDRELCLDKVRDFYLLTRPENANALLFCGCEAHADADADVCERVRAAVFPTCTVIQDPPPSCSEILQQCGADENCRTRWQDYSRYCSYDNRTGGCPTTVDRCRKSQASLMGTILTTNCTCHLQNSQEQEKCLDARKQLQDKNVCKETALKQFDPFHSTTPDTLWADDSANGNNMQISVHEDRMAGCLRELGHDIPSYMDVPNVIRRYTAEADCSEVCQCKTNGTMVCTRLPCGPKVSCTTKTKQVYLHGSSFNHKERGECRCIRGEVVCSKPDENIKLNQGLHLRVGYSVSDMYLLEANSDVKCSPRNIADKLGAILNKDSAEQFCDLELDKPRSIGNLVFVISPSENSPIMDKSCVDQAKMLDSKINMRDKVIVSDAELSILKVAQLERVIFYTEPPEATPQSIMSEYSSGAPRVGLPSALVVVLFSLLLVVDTTRYDHHPTVFVKSKRKGDSSPNCTDITERVTALS